jgi:hypothetical protein
MLIGDCRNVGADTSRRPGLFGGKETDNKIEELDKLLGTGSGAPTVIKLVLTDDICKNHGI